MSLWMWCLGLILGLSLKNLPFMWHVSVGLPSFLPYIESDFFSFDFLVLLQWATSPAKDQAVCLNNTMSFSQQC
jgi:hypothetical protein